MSPELAAKIRSKVGESFTDIELGIAYRTMVDDFGLTEEQIAEVTGIELAEVRRLIQGGR